MSAITTLLGQTLGATAPGNSGIITASNITATSMTLTWTKATDSVDPQSSLQYRAYYSTSAQMESVTEIKAGTAINAYTTDINTVNVSGLTAATRYYFNVLVKDTSGNETPYTKLNQPTTDAVAPVAGNSGTITTSNLSATSVTLNWTAATDNLTAQADLQYLAYYSTNSSLDSVSDIETYGTAVGSYTANIITKQINSLSSTTTYYYNVIVKDESQNKSAYAKGSITTLDNVSPTPGNSGILSTSAVAGTSLTLSWTEATDNLDPQASLEYLAYYSLNSSMNSVANIEANGTAFGSYTADIATKSITGLNSETQYYFNVIVKDTSGNKSAYTQTTDTTLDITAPTPGSSGAITPTSVNSDSIAISWIKANDTVTAQANLQYLVYYSTNSVMDSVSDIESNGTAVGSYTADINTKSIPSLSSSTTYYINVIVKDEADNKAAYAKLTQATSDITAPVPGAGGTISTTYTSNTRIDIGWTKATDDVSAQSALEYLAYYSTSSSMDTIGDIELNGTAIGSYAADINEQSATGLSEGVTYYFNVIVKDESGNKAAYAKLAQATTDITAPTPGGSGTITVSDLGSTSLTLNWTAATDDFTIPANLQYLAYYSLNSSLDSVMDIETNGTPVGTYEAAIITKQVLSLSSSTTYYFNVIVKDEVGNKAAYTKKTQETLDITPPIPGNSGILSVADVTSTSFTVNWTVATDNNDDSATLQYLVYYSTSSSMNSVANIEMNGTPVGTYATDINTKPVSGLTTSSNYYINVIVKDLSENKSAYAQQLVSLDTTHPVPGGGGTIVIPTETAKANAITLQWTKATDDLTNQAQLQYLVYYSTNPAMDTLEEVKANGTAFGSYEYDINSKEVTGLLAGTDYYFNIMVKDNSNVLLQGPGNETVYGKQHYLTPTLDVVLASPVPDTGSTLLTTIPFTVTFIPAGYDLNDSTFTEGDITVTNGSVETSSLTGTNLSWSFNVVPSVVGEVTVQILANKVQDQNSNDNTASNIWHFYYTTSMDITRLARFVLGLPRDVDMDTNTLHVESLEVGELSPAALSKAMAELLVTTYTTGLPGANMSAGAKQATLETKLVALRASVNAFTPTTGNTSDTVTTQVLAAAEVDIPVGAGNPVSSADAWGIFVGTVSGSSDIGKVLLRVNGSDNGIDDGNGDEAYGVLSESGGAYTLSYKKADGTNYTITADDTSKKFDFHFVEITDLYSFGVDRLLSPPIGGVIDNTTVTEEEVSARLAADSSIWNALYTEITNRTNADDLEITARQNADATILAAIEPEASARALADGSVQGQIDLLAPAREATDSSLQIAIDDEGSTRNANDATLDGDVTNEALARDTQDSNLVLAALLDEESGRNASDANVQSLVDGEAYDRGLADVTLQANLDIETTLRANADVTLQSNIDLEALAREDADSSILAMLTSAESMDSSLQAALDAEITARMDGDSTLQVNIDTEASVRADADVTLQINIDAEASVRADADATLQMNIDAEASVRADADVTLQANLDLETTARMDADLTPQANLDVETTARMDADSSLQALIDAEMMDMPFADLAIESNLDAEIVIRIDADSYISGSITTEAGERTSADFIVETNLGVEATARMDADSSIQTLLDIETTARSESDASIQASLDLETTSRIDADNTLQYNFDIEASARIESDQSLQFNLDTETSSRLDSDSSLQGNLNTETTARLNADSSLQSLIDNYGMPKVDVLFTAGTGGISSGDVVIEDTTAGTCVKANAGSLVTCESVLGVSLETKSAGQAVMIRTYGEAIVTTDGTNFDVGKRVYVATSNGKASKSFPTGEGSVVYLLGSATDTNKVFVSPNLEDVIEITPLEEFIPAGSEVEIPADSEKTAPST